MMGEIIVCNIDGLAVLSRIDKSSKEYSRARRRPFNLPIQLLLPPHLLRAIRHNLLSIQSTSIVWIHIIMPYILIQGYMVLLIYLGLRLLLRTRLSITSTDNLR